jgi:hypothetical protein
MPIGGLTLPVSSTSSGPSTTESSSTAGNAALHYRVIRTPLASSTTRDIFFGRFRKEIIEKYGFAVPAASSSSKADRGGAAQFAKRPTPDYHGNETDRTNILGDRIRQLLRQRIVVGVNECTRILELASSSAVEADNPRRDSRHRLIPCSQHEHPDGAVCLPPLLIVVAADGTRQSSPVTMTHIPVLADRLDIPVLLLPDPSSRKELGSLLGIKSASIVVFLPPSSKPPSESASVESASSRQVAQAEADLDSFVDFLRNKVLQAQDRTKERELIGMGRTTNLKII